jgi:hypothetical protein
MHPVHATKVVVLVAVVVLILYDIVAFWWGGQDATISQVIVKLSFDNPIIPFAAGVLCGHLFWRD